MMMMVVKGSRMVVEVVVADGKGGGGEGGDDGIRGREGRKAAAGARDGGGVVFPEVIDNSR